MIPIRVARARCNVFCATPYFRLMTRSPGRSFPAAYFPLLMLSLIRSHETAAARLKPADSFDFISILCADCLQSICDTILSLVEGHQTVNDK